MPSAVAPHALPCSSWRGARDPKKAGGFSTVPPPLIPHVVAFPVLYFAHAQPASPYNEPPTMESPEATGITQQWAQNKQLQVGEGGHDAACDQVSLLSLRLCVTIPAQPSC